MAISFPLAFPTTETPVRVRFMAESAVELQESPFTFVQTSYSHPGDRFLADVELPPMGRADAAAWVAFLLKLNGQEGTFLMGDPSEGVTPRGTWAWGSPTANVNGVHAAGAKTITVRDFSAGATGKEMDWIQFGSGSTASLHQVVQDFTASGAGAASIEIWPSLKAALANGAVFTVQSAVGLWRLASNRREWSIGEAQQFGVSFSAVQAF